MVKLTFLFATLTAVMVAKTCAWVPGEAQCGCFNLAQVDKPSSISECYPKFKFLNQISVNYNNLLTALFINGGPYNCNFTQYIRNVYGMKDLTVGIVDAYFSCNKADCTSAIMAAYGKFVDFRTSTFNPYTICSMTNLSPDCAQVLLQVRPPVYGSAENILVAMLTCAKLKAQEPNGIVQVSPAVSFRQFILSNKVSECNCITIDPRPIPKSKEECFSADYIATVRNFINVNFGRVISTYNMTKDSCDYKELLGYIQQLQNVALEGTTLLESTSSNLTQVDTIYNKYKGLLAQYNPAVRQFILSNDQSCYFNVRKSRVSPLTITDAVVSILTKCIQYVDVPNKRC
ncbi:uncharacterized protein LOC119074425 [Bradysia coprophila]|uniref:uncharacterized protein LOC119074425 n=1 Tax=Bradysia coprophila TaxID=38358 RepID=UPI00187D9731|nr:uncharacterized protein LOC119074425 [Bradysia coprophila]